ncbi:MAG: hypothetical protein R3B40_08025 [Polyangiales bacterium]|nr:hypothetical protein [Myxococcales bacterium]MCB9660698.1 hypothetical protein [Sandaracinaceae bacterium]
MSADARSRLTELALTLRHDVGKYVTRAARNLPPEDPPPVLLDMLVADLFRTDGTHTALAVYEARVSASQVSEADVPPGIRVALEALMALEPRVRAHHADAVSEACRLALVVDDACRAFVRAQEADA